jgi:hypothetical protein
MLKIQKKVGFFDLCWIFIGLLDWIRFLSLIQSNNPIKIQQKSNKNPTKIQKSKNPTLWIFGVGCGWMFNHLCNPKSRKK